MSLQGAAWSLHGAKSGVKKMEASQWNRSKSLWVILACGQV